MNTFTRVRYYPDLEKFNMKSITDIDLNLMKAYIIVSGFSNNIFKKNTI